MPVPAGPSRLRRLLLCVVLGWVVLLAGGCDDIDELREEFQAVVVKATAGDYDVTFTEGDCPFFFDFEVEPEVVEAITCGYLQVPQDRAQPRGLQIELAVAIIDSVASTPRPDPILYLEGGLGGGALIAAEDWLESALRDEYRIILLDQRGTGFSWPNLGCPELDDVDDWDGDAFLAALAECRDRLTAMGVDLSSYHSAASAQDVADLRQVLGVERWNLLGISYGTRLALTILRDSPEGVRSAILDSVYPPNVHAYAEQALTFAGAIDALLDGCSRDRACRRAFPDLRATFFRLLRELDEAPLYFDADEIGADEDSEVDAYTFLSLITDALYDTELIPLLPMLIADTYAGDYDLLLWEFLYYDEEDAYHRQRPDSAEMADEGSLADAHGAFYAVECYEEAPFAALDEAVALAAALDPLIADLLLTDVAQFFDACAIWGTTPAAGHEAEAVFSEIPVLILAGEYDPVTPPAWAKLAAQTLPNHVYVELPRGGHGLTGVDWCIDEIMLAFLAAPTRTPRTGCIADVVRDFELP